MKKQRMLLSVLTSVVCCVCLSSTAFAETKAKAPTSKPVTKKAKKAKPAIRTTITVNPPSKRKPAIRTTITVNPPSKRKPEVRTTIVVNRPTPRKPAVRTTITVNQPKVRTTITVNRPTPRKPEVRTTITVKKPTPRKPAIRTTITVNKPKVRTTIVVNKPKVRTTITVNRTRPVPARRAVAAKTLQCKKTICAMYSATAMSKVAWGCGLKFKGNCKCTKTANSCGKNWRGATKYNYDCSCTTTQKNMDAAKKQAKSPSLGQLCERKFCSLYGSTAKAKVAWKCGWKFKGNCSCQKTAEACGKNWRGAMKYNYNCRCRATCKQTVCALYTTTAQGKASWSCGWKKGYSTRRCKCVKTTQSCGSNWRGATKYNYACDCK